MKLERLLELAGVSELKTLSLKEGLTLTPDQEEKYGGSLDSVTIVMKNTFKLGLSLGISANDIQADIADALQNLKKRATEGMGM